MVGLRVASGLQPVAALGLRPKAAALLPAAAGLARHRPSRPCAPRRSAPVISAKALNQDALTPSGGGSGAPVPPSTTDSRTKGIIQLAIFGVTVCLAAAAGGIWIDTFSTPFCATTPDGCEQIPLYMKLPLVATHLLTFVLIPATMYVFYTRSSALKQAGAQDPFTAMLGLAYIMVAIAGEMGWHVTQEWFYVEDYSVLNFMFYFFLMLGTSGWAIGIKEDDTTTSKDEWIDVLLLATPWLAGLAYLAGAAVTHTKVPIYALLSIQYAVLTYRFWNLLKTPKVFLFPFFSVGVNLFFIAQLNAHKSDPILNPLFHILHDAAGTELGVAIIATLVYLQLPANAEGPRLK